MADSNKTIKVKVERTISASPSQAFDAWLNPAVKGTPWQMNDKLIFDPKVDGLWYWLIRGMAHYGLFTKLDRPHVIEHTWVSPNTLGRESIIKITFQEKGADTLMTLLHSGIPDNEAGRSHIAGWNSFLNEFLTRFGAN